MRGSVITTASGTRVFAPSGSRVTITRTTSSAGNNSIFDSGHHHRHHHNNRFDQQGYGGYGYGYGMPGYGMPNPMSYGGWGMPTPYGNPFVQTTAPQNSSSNLLSEILLPGSGILRAITGGSGGFGGVIGKVGGFFGKLFG